MATITNDLNKAVNITYAYTDTTGQNGISGSEILEPGHSKVLPLTTEQIGYVSIPGAKNYEIKSGQIIFLSRLETSDTELNPWYNITAIIVAAVLLIMMEIFSHVGRY